MSRTNVFGKCKIEIANDSFSYSDIVSKSAMLLIKKVMKLDRASKGLVKPINFHDTFINCKICSLKIKPQSFCFLFLINIIDITCPDWEDLLNS